MQKPFVKWGMIAAGISVAISLIFYLISPESINSFWAGAIPVVAMIYCAVMAGQEERELQGGYMTWGQALVPSLLTILVYMVITMVFSYILITLIDPSLAEMQTEAALEMQEKIMNMMGAEMTDAQIEEIQSRASPTLWNTVIGIFWAMLCFGFPVAAIIALFVQKKNPENDLLA